MSPLLRRSSYPGARLEPGYGCGSAMLMPPQQQTNLLCNSCNSGCRLREFTQPAWGFSQLGWISQGLNHASGSGMQVAVEHSKSDNSACVAGALVQFSR